VKGNEDRRGGVVGYAEILLKMRQAVDRAAESATNVKLDLAAVLAWLDVTGVTGYYASQRDQAAHALPDARDQARKLRVHIDRALAQMREIA